MKVGFIGLGIMGGSMASNLQAAGHTLCVHDIRRPVAAPHLAAGAEWKDTPRQVAEAVDVVFTSLPGRFLQPGFADGGARVMRYGLKIIF